MTSLAQQNVSELGGRLSVLNRQKQDHVQLDRLLHRLGDASDREHDRVLRSIYRLVFPHAFAEEAVLWPVMRRVLPDGHALTLRVEQEHQEINQLVTRLESLGRGSPAYQEVLGRVVALLRADVRDEEDALLPRLQARLSPAQLQLLGLAWEAVRWVAPTRAHPVVARRPPGNWLSALPLALVDRCRDLADAIADGRSGPATAPLRALSSGLSRVSHGIERLPGMRRGEDPSTRVSGRSPGRWTVFAVVSLAAASGALLAARRR
ncbi:MAG TPA: hemerythrin domain-containing protein [Allosphingosinicella sp.]|jgi:hypothetical protein